IFHTTSPPSRSPCTTNGMNMRSRRTHAISLITQETRWRCKGERDGGRGWRWRIGFPYYLIERIAARAVPLPAPRNPLSSLTDPPMIYQYLPPNPALREFVRDYLIAHFVFDKDKPIPVKAFAPRPEQAMAFLPRGGLVMHNAISGEQHAAPATSICGQQLSRYNFHLTREYLMFRINFHPGALFRLLRIPLNEFSDTWFDAESTLGHETTEVNDRL